MGEGGGDSVHRLLWLISGVFEHSVLRVWENLCFGKCGVLHLQSIYGPYKPIYETQNVQMHLNITSSSNDPIWFLSL